MIDGSPSYGGTANRLVNTDRAAWTMFEARFWPKVQKTENCWLWIGARNNYGYGVILGPDRQHFVYAHRASYEMTGLPIPDGMTVDHLCYTRACVRPDHLEPVTQLENVRRYLERKRSA